MQRAEPAVLPEAGTQPAMIAAAATGVSHEFSRVQESGDPATGDETLRLPAQASAAETDDEVEDAPIAAPASVLVDPLERARAVLEDARRQMPGLMGREDEVQGAPAVDECAALVPASVQELRLPAEWLTLMGEIVAERRALTAEVASLRGLVLDLRGEVDRLAAMLAVPEDEPRTEAIAEAAPDAETTAPALAEQAAPPELQLPVEPETPPVEEPATAAPTEEAVVTTAIFEPEPAETAIEVAVTGDEAPLRAFEFNVRLLAEIQERLASGFPSGEVASRGGGWPARALWSPPPLVPEPPAAAPQEHENAGTVHQEVTDAPAEALQAACLPPEAVGTQFVPFPAEARVEREAVQPEDASREAIATAPAGVPERRSDPVTAPDAPPDATLPVARDFGWRVRPDRQEDRLPASWHRHAALGINDYAPAGAAAGAPASPAPGGAVEPALPAALNLLVGPVGGIKRLAALEQRLAASSAVARMELATFRGGDALFRVQLQSGADVESMLIAIEDAETRIGDYIVSPDQRSVTVRLHVVPTQPGAG